jgi:hypothetical protein
VRAVIAPGGRLSHPLLAANWFVLSVVSLMTLLQAEVFVSSNGRLISHLINGSRGVWNEDVVLI